MPNGKYDPATGTIVFKSAESGTFAVAFVQKTFADIDKLDWAKNQIEVFASKGIVNGTSEQLFGPGSQVTRADFLLLLMRTLELKGELGASFADVPDNAYYGDALRMARSLGITEGNGDNRFQPLKPITREDMMVLTAQALRAAKQSLGESASGGLSGFADQDAVAGYAKDSVESLLRSGIVHGYNDRIQPKAATTRAEAVVLLYNLYRALQDR